MQILYGIPVIHMRIKYYVYNEYTAVLIILRVWITCRQRDSSVTGKPVYTTVIRRGLWWHMDSYQSQQVRMMDSFINGRVYCFSNVPIILCGTPSIQ